MFYWLESDIAVVLVATILSSLLIPQIINVAHIRKLYDDNSARKIHHGVIPRLGGLAFVPAVLFSVCLVLAICLSIGGGNINSEIHKYGIAMLYLCCAVTLLYLIGVADDLVGVPHSGKLIVQILSAILIIASGEVIPCLDGLFGIWNLRPIWSYLLSGFIVVYLINAINFIDGIDGLAAGLSVIALIFYAVILYMAGSYLYSMLACATIGALLAFLYFNVFGDAKKAKKTFMGDTGSMTLGAVLAFLGMSVSALPKGASIDYVDPFVLAYSPLLVPAFDMVRVILHRMMIHQSPFLASNVHIHHKFLALKYNQRITLIIVLMLAVIFLCANILAAPYISITVLMIIDIVVWTIGNILLTRVIRKRQKRFGYEMYK